MRLAIVVPTLDEEEALRRNLPAALAAADEVVVSDGGSRDGTVALARALGARTVCGEPGRGRQLNRGAAATTAGLLLFLHADTTLPPGAARQVRDAVAAGAVAGAFALRFDTGHPVMRLGERLVGLRTRLTRLPLGDQAQFITRAAFERLGGFRDWPILEDLDLMLRLKKGKEKVALLDSPVTTSARRYLEGGIVRTVATNWLIWLLFTLGVPPERLAGLYRHIR
jgi:rSAM/selenodomain-associated transferase 2